MTLQERLAQINNETRAWVAAGPDRWAGELTEDPAHWAEIEVFTAEQLDAYLDNCVEAATSDADRAYYDREDDFDFEDMCREMDADYNKWTFEMEAAAIEKEEYAKCQVYANYQDGWI